MCMCMHHITDIDGNKPPAQICVLVVQVLQHPPQISTAHAEMHVQMAECQQLREELQQQLQHIQQVLIQLDEKEAHLLLQCQNVVQASKATQVLKVRQ